MRPPASSAATGIAPLVWPLLLVALTFLAYFPVGQAGFVWDDDAYVTGNRALRTVDGLWRIWLEPGAVPQYYPLVFTSFWIEQRLWGLAPLGYHVVNVLLHAGSAVLLWRVLALLEVRAAWLAAALFALHPVQVESVAWITERKNVLSGCFYLAAALAYLRSGLGGAPQTDRVERGGSRSRVTVVVGRHHGRAGARPSTICVDRDPAIHGIAAYAVALILFLCALLSKTVTCSLPAALLLALWWRRGRLTRADVVPLLPFFALGVLLALATVRLERVHVGAAGADWNLSAIERCLIAGRALWFYAGTLIWPARLTFVYPRWEIDASVWWQYLYPVAAAAVFAVLVAFRRRIGTGPLIAVLFFAGTLVPALGFFDVFPMRYSYVADHFQYLASIGLLTLAASVGSLALARAGWERAAPFLAGALLCVLASLVWRQAAVYRDVETLWRDALAKNPGAWMAHNNLGLLLFQRGDDAAALHEYEAALRLKPDDAFAHNNIATVLAQRGDGAAAMEHLQAALRLEPANAEAHNNLGSLLASQGDLPLAAAHFETAVRLKPRYADAQSNLANVLALQGRTAEAIARYREALRLDPEYADAHRNLGTVLASAGDAAGAAVHLAEALRLRPADDVARQQLEALQTNVE